MPCDAVLGDLSAEWEPKVTLGSRAAEAVRKDFLNLTFLNELILPWKRHRPENGRKTALSTMLIKMC